MQNTHDETDTPGSSVPSGTNAEDAVATGDVRRGANRCATSHRMPAHILSRLNAARASNAELWLKALQNKTEATRSQQEGRKYCSDDAKDVAVISNLEESYFQKPASGLGSSAQRRLPATKKDEMARGLSADAEGESENESLFCSPEATPHCSFKSGHHRSQPGSKSPQHQKRVLSQGKLPSAKKAQHEKRLLSQRKLPWSSIHRTGQAGDEAGEEARATEKSKKSPAEIEEVAFAADLKRAIVASLAREPSRRGAGKSSDSGGVIDLVASEEEKEARDEEYQMKEAMGLSLDESKKVRAYAEKPSGDGDGKQEEATTTMEEERSTLAQSGTQSNEEDQMKEAMRLSLKESKKVQEYAEMPSGDSNGEEATLSVEVEGSTLAQSGTSSNEENQMKEAIRRSLEESEKVQQHAERWEPTYRCLTRPELEAVVEAFVAKQGGWDKIEGGKLITHGNANDMKKACVADGGGRNQTGAQYGRYSMRRMWRVFDVLEGRADINNYEAEGAAAAGAPRSEANEGSESQLKGEAENGGRLQGLPGARIRAFVDIGHGMGIQVLQAGWGPMGVPSQGVEIMTDRHLIAKSIREGVLEECRNDPPDSSLVNLKLADFSRAVVPDQETHLRDEQLRRSILFCDMPEEVREGLVIFVNNAEEVFGARSNQKNGGASLDSHLATLFGNMRVGGRMVTLTDISCHLSRSSEWFARSAFQSGTGAVSWGNENKSVDVHVLTKLRNEWFCQNRKCEHLSLGRGKCPNPVVDEVGNLLAYCWKCRAPAKRCSRLRKPSRKRRRDEG